MAQATVVKKHNGGTIAQNKEHVTITLSKKNLKQACPPRLGS
jgi:hypothetical protein